MFMCNRDRCTAEFTAKRSLYRHVRSKHEHDSISEFKCTECNFSTKRLDSLRRHEQVHNKSNKDHPATCNKCNLSFTLKSNLKRHVKSNHNGNESEFLCNECDFSTKRRASLKRHITVKHSTEALEKLSTIRCCICKAFTASRLLMSQHYTLEHDIMIEGEELEFPSYSSFDEWKLNLEKGEYSFFRAYRSPWVRSSDKCSKSLLVCFRSGLFKTRGKQLRHLKSLGSNKINGHCPAQIDITHHPSGKVAVHYIKTHLGHHAELGRLRLPKFDRDRIASKIPFDDILDSIGSSIRGSEIERGDLLTKYDLHNIVRDYNLHAEPKQDVSPTDDIEALEVECDLSNTEQRIMENLQHRGLKQCNESVEKGKGDLLKEFMSILDGVGSDNDLKIVQKIMLTMRPTLQAHQSTTSSPTLEHLVSSSAEAVHQP